MSNFLTRQIYAFMISCPESRDEMLLCVKHIHENEMKTMKIEKADYYDALFEYKLSSITTIDRIWRKIQEDHKELRGKSWELRQAQAGLIKIEDTSYLKNQYKLFDFE